MSLRDDRGELVSVPFAIEHLIDAHGLAEVLCAIANVCAEKASHIRESYSNDALASQWAQASGQVDSCAGSRKVRAVSP